MAKATKGQIEDIHNNAGRHRDSANAFQEANTKVQNTVDGLTAINKGDLMDKLDALQNEWSANVKKVVNDLNDMASYLDDVANKIQQQDADSGGGLN
ncbi:WXG100 family type VII secretion target [Dactylosporangium sp. NBC_01737]|uniref:WXG100 family type VII secretion target n=1 Tax=Dactylosporangium sp. NBC_01737 TaxID=2975959 RepID=UPI002E13E872|nr:WXG100 family type VII secretion target [Dactylosporangium sp. NBC_01737]